MTTMVAATADPLPPPQPLLLLLLLLLPSIASAASSSAAAAAAAAATAPTATATAVTTAKSAAADDDECVLDLAIVCLDDKLLVYVNWLEKRDKLNVVGEIVTIVKKKQAGRAEDRSKPHANKPPHQGPHPHRVSTSLGPAIDEYFDTHTLRISLPWILDDDIDLELDQQSRGKKPKLKHLKKMMSMLGVIMCAKLSMMGPLAMLMVGAKALKALMLAVASLTISKLMLLKKMKGGGGGGYGGGGYTSGSISQADWSSDKDDRNAHLLAYAGQTAAAAAAAAAAMQQQQQQQQQQQLQQQQQQMYPSYEPHGYHGAA